jgi:uncharacterized protein
MKEPLNQPIAVVDINVFVSGGTISQSYPRAVMDMWRNHEFQLATSERILTRLRRVFSYPQVVHFTKKTPSQVEELVQEIRASAIVVSGTTPANVTTEPEDNTLFSCAVEANAAYIVSGDEAHVLPVREYLGIQTVRPKEFVEVVRKQKKAA